jgi:hypothetical protein
MLSLIETLTGFTAIMLMLSLLVKTLTSVIKNQWDYYSDNLKHEVQRLVLETTGRTWNDVLGSASEQAKNLIGEIHWERLGDEFLNATYLSWFLKKLDSNADLNELESRLKVRLANVKYAFQMRMKNLALAVGVGLCLLCNINAFTIWKSLYTDGQLRATFASSYADKATKLAEAQARGTSQETSANQANQASQATQGNQTDKVAPANDSNTKMEKNQLDTQMKDFRQNMQGFLTDVSFGVGRIWREECLRLADAGRQQCQKEMMEKTTKLKQDSRDKKYEQRVAEAGKLADPAAKEKANLAADETRKAEEKADLAEAGLKLAREQRDTQKAPEILIYEFLGSLLTGILVSIGAPYWHDVLQALSSLRSIASTTKAKA